MVDGERHHRDPILPEIQEVIRALATSMRAARLYPENNPVQQQAIRRAFQFLDQYLHSHQEFVLSVQKFDFAYGAEPAGKDQSLYRSIANDLFVKGVREIMIKQGITLSELQRFFTVLSIPLEQFRQIGTVKAMIWEENIPHVDIKEAELDELMLRDYMVDTEEIAREGHLLSPEELRQKIVGKSIDLFGKKVMLSQVVDDPGKFGALMADIARNAGDTQEIRENKLFDLYREGGRQILQTPFEQRGQLFDALAESVMSMDPLYREGLIVRKLYPEFEAENLRAYLGDNPERLPEDLHELLTARFFKSWTIPQVSAVLRKAASSQFEPVPSVPERTGLPESLYALARELADYNPDEMESLRTLGDYTAERAVLEAVVRTLIYVLHNVRNPFVESSEERHLNLFSAVVGHLEELLALVLEKKDYASALLIIRSYRIPVEPLFQQRLSDALKRAGDKKIIEKILDEIRSLPKDSGDYQTLQTYLSLLGREVTPLLLELLSEERDRSIRNLLFRLLKDLGKGQLALLGERLSDGRWYFVRNIVTILGQSRREEVVSYLEKVANHKNFQIRQEVVRALLMIKGERATRLLIRFLNDRDVDIRFMAVRGLGMSLGTEAKAEMALIDFLKGGWLRRISNEMKAEAVASLGKIGGTSAAAFLKKYRKFKWWKLQKLHHEMRNAVDRAIEHIERRIGSAGRAK